MTKRNILAYIFRVKKNLSQWNDHTVARQVVRPSGRRLLLEREERRVHTERADVSRSSMFYRLYFLAKF